MKTLQRLLVVFAFAIAGLFVAPSTASACGYFSGFEDCQEAPKYGGRHGGIEISPTWRNDCIWFCGEGHRQRTWVEPEPLFDNYPHWYDVDPGKASGGTGKCSNGGPSLLGWCP